MISLTVDHDHNIGQFRQRSMTESHSLWHGCISHIVTDRNRQRALRCSVGVGQAQRDAELSADRIYRSAHFLYRLCRINVFSVTGHGKPSIAVTGTCQSYGSVLVKETAVDRRSEQQLRRHGVHHKGIGGVKSVAVLCLAHDADAVFTIRKIAELNGNRIRILKRRCHAFIQLPCSADRLICLCGHGECVCGIHRFGNIGGYHGSVGTDSRFFHHSPMCRLVGRECQCRRACRRQINCRGFDLFATQCTLSASHVDCMIRRNADDIFLFRFQSDGYCFGVILRINSLIGSADLNHSITAFCRFVTNLFKIGHGSILIINADKITVRICILLQSQFILEVTVRLGTQNNHSARRVAVMPTQFLTRAENNAVDLIGLGVDCTDIIVTAWHIARYGQGMSSAFQYRTILYHANPITGIGIGNIIVLAQIKTYLVKFAHVGAVPCKINGIPVCHTAD